jgi:hypothetical protein
VPSEISRGDAGIQLALRLPIYPQDELYQTAGIIIAQLPTKAQQATFPCQKQRTVSRETSFHSARPEDGQMLHLVAACAQAIAR